MHLLFVTHPFFRPALVMQSSVTLWEITSGCWCTPSFLLDLSQISAEHITARIRYKTINLCVSTMFVWVKFVVLFSTPYGNGKCDKGNDEHNNSTMLKCESWNESKEHSISPDVTWKSGKVQGHRKCVPGNISQTCHK